MPCSWQQVGHPALRPTVHHRVLHLVRDDPHPRGQELGQVRATQFVTPRWRIFPAERSSSSHRAASIQPGTA